MSARFPVPCPVSKMISANHAWCGFAPFDFPGFAATYNDNTITSGSAPTALGQLVLSTLGSIGGTGYYVYKLTTLLPSGWPVIDPQIDSVGSALSFPNIVPAGAQFNGGASIPGNGGTGSYTLTGLIIGLEYGYTLGGLDNSVNGLTASSGTFTATSTSITITCVNYPPFATPINVESSVYLAPSPRHFTLWDYKMIGSDTIAAEDGPTAYPLVDVGSNLNREIWGTGLSSGTAYLSLEITNDFSGLAGASGSPGADTIVEAWTVNKYTGNITDSGASPTPNSSEAGWMFPAVAKFNSPILAPILVSLTASATGLGFEFGYFDGTSLYNFTQTLALSSEYDLSTAVSDCAALLSGNSGSVAALFATLNWSQQTTCTYNGDGSVGVAVSSIGATVSQGTGCVSGAPGGASATAAAGFGYNALVDGKDLAMSTSLIDVCGAYCLRTFHCTNSTPVVDCASGTVDGYAPVTISVPAIPSGETQVWSYLFPNCQCT